MPPSRRGPSLTDPVPPVPPVGTPLRRLYDEMGAPPLGVAVPDEWVGIAVEMVQELRKRCPHIRLRWLREREGALLVGYRGFRGREAEADVAWKVICAANEAVREIDRRLGVVRGKTESEPV